MPKKIIHSSHAVANSFILLARSELKLLTNLQLQKMVYIANGFSLALLDRPLFHNKIIASEFGPIIPDLYEGLLGYGAGAVTETVYCKDAVNPNSELYKVIRGVYKSYGVYTAEQLSDMLREPDMPWDIVYHQAPESIIPPQLIQQKYKEKVEAGESTKKAMQETVEA